MNKKIKNLFLAGLAIFSLAGVAVSCTDYDDDIDSLQDKTDSLEEQVSELSTKLTQAQNDIAGLQTSVSNLQSALTTLQTAVEDLQDLAATHATKEELEAAKTELTNAINTVKTQLETKISQVQADLEQKIKDAESNANTYTDEKVAAALKEAKEYADSLKKVVDEALAGKVDVTTFNETVARLDGEINGLKGRVTAVEADLEKVHDELDSLAQITLSDEALIKKNTEDIKANEAKIADLQKQIDSLKNVTANNEDDIQANANKIAALEDKVADLQAEDTKLNARIDSLAKVTATNESNIATNKDNIAANKAAIEALDKKIDEAIARLGGKLKGLVFDAQAYVDGVPAIDVLSMDVNKVKINDQDTENEKPDADGAASINGDVQADYYLNPSNATVTDAFEYSYILNQEGNTPFYVTRSKASDDFSVTPKFNKSENGILTVDLTVTGAPADSEYITIIKLQAKEGSDTAVVSNEHTIYRNIFDSVLVANQKANQTKDTYKDVADQHYRNNYYGGATVAINAADANAYDPVSGNAIYDKTYIWTDHIDTTLTKGSALDLKGIVAAHAFKGGVETELSDEQMAKLHLTWDFSLVKYSFVDPQTEGSAEQDQSAYVKLDSSSLTVNTAKGLSVNGRTPIVRAILKHGDDNVAVGYIKIGIKIDESDVLNPQVDIENELTSTFLFDCDKDSSYVIAWKDQLDSLAERNGYDDLTKLFADYPVLIDMSTDSGKVYKNATSDSLKWIIPMDSVWAHAGEVITRDIELANGDTSLVIPVTLKANVAEITKEYNLSSANGDYINEYWWSEDGVDASGYDITKFNVRIPKVGENTPDSCLFLNDLNAAFVNKDGKIVINNDTTITKVDFFFCANDLDGKEFTFGDTTVTFDVVNDTVLMVGTDTIAVIYNNESTVPYNVLKLNKNSNVAKRLLNTDALYTYIGAKAYYCGKTNYPVTVTFDGEDHFRGDFIRPIYLTENSEKGFIDAVDEGEEGSYIDLADLVNPYDWRNREFSDSSYYWGYYGPFKFTVDTENITCDLNGGDPATNPVPETIDLVQRPNGWDGHISKAGEAGGFLTYKSNGNNVSSFNLYVPVTVEYGWGQIKTTSIKVHVTGTNE